MIGNRLSNILITLAFIAIFAIYFVFNYEDFEILLSIKIGYVALILVIQTLILVVNGLFLAVNLKVFNFNISVSEATKTTILTAIGNFFTPFRGGAGIRAIYLKKTYNLPYSSFLSTLAVYYIVLFLINSIIAFIGLSFIQYNGNPINTVLLLGFLLFIIFLVYLIIFPNHIKFLIHKILPGKRFGVVGRFIELVDNTIEGWKLVAHNKRVLLQLSLLGFLNACLAIALYYVELRGLGIEIGFLNVTVFAAISSISLLFSITPGSLGIKESLLVLFQTSLALNTSQILSVSVLDRSINFFLLLALAFIANFAFKSSPVGNIQVEPNAND